MTATEKAALTKALAECEKTAREYEDRSGVYANGRPYLPGAEHVAKGIRAAVVHVRKAMKLGAATEDGT